MMKISDKPLIKLEPEAVVIGFYLHGTLAEDHPVQEHLKKGTDIKSSSVLTTKYTVGIMIVETRNSIYVYKSSKDQI